MTSSQNFQVGDLVLLYQDDVPHHSWPRGIIYSVFVNSKDGLVRRVQVRLSANKFLERNFRKVCLLEAVGSIP